jgi:hypothetical protein
MGVNTMQTCSLCYTQSSDSVAICPKCQVELREYSTTAVALKRFQNNSRVLTIRLAIPDDACPACHAVEGTYAKDKAPILPVEGCSEPNGCRGFYEPVLDEIYP